MAAEEVDVCVIGSGAGGGVAAYALAAAGFSIVVLEAGPRFDPALYALDETDWESAAKLLKIPAGNSQNFTSGPPQPLDPRYEHLRAWSQLGRFASPTHRSPPQIFRVKGVGGCTLHYQGEAHRFSPHGFVSRSELGYADDWPIRYEDLEPYYERMERLLGVAGDHRNPHKPPRLPFPNPPHFLSCATQRVKQGFDRLGLTLWPNSLAILSRPKGDRPPCNYCNGCERGCMTGAKSSMDVTLIPQAEATGRVRVISNAMARDIPLDKMGKAKGVTYFDRSGVEHFQPAKLVVLAAGALESPRLLLHATSNRFSDGLANRSGLVGRNFMETLVYFNIALFEDPIHSYKGTQIDARCWDFNQSDPQRAFRGGVVFGVSALNLLGPLSYTKHLVRGWGLQHKQRMRELFGRVIHLFAVGEHLPHPDNRITLDEEARDSFGIPLPKVTVALSQNELDMLDFMRSQARAILGAAGVKEILGEISAYDTDHISHMSGTCRMGTDPQSSVVNEFCQSHDVPNLFITDASCFVTEGGGDSPSLTIQALALRASDYIAAQAKKGNL